MDRLYSHIDLRRQRNQQGLLFTFYDVFNYLSIADEIAVSEMIFLLKYSNIRIKKFAHYPSHTLHIYNKYTNVLIKI